MTLTRHYGLVECSQCHPDVLCDPHRHHYDHDRWERGVLVPARVRRSQAARLAAPVCRVDAYEDPMALRRVAYEMARCARREGRWDFPSFPLPEPYHWPQRNGWAYLCVRDGRAVGYVAVWVEPMGSEDGPVYEVLGPFWTAHAHRRSGVAAALFAEARARATHPLAWLGPFTEAGHGFAEAMDPDKQLISCS